LRHEEVHLSVPSDGQAGGISPRPPRTSRSAKPRVTMDDQVLA
jgi:hypothetical protein